MIGFLGTVNRSIVIGALALAMATGCGDDSNADGADSDVADSGTTVVVTTEAPTSDSASSSGTTAADETADSGSDSSSGGPMKGCWDDLPVGESEVFYQGFTDGSEGLAFGVDGNLYATTIVGGVGTVWQLDAEGTAVEYASLPTALGLAPLRDGGFIVASFGEANMADGAVYHLDPRGTPSEIATGIDSPNFVTITPSGDALISDDFDTRVFLVDLAGNVTTAIADVPSPNGMAYGPNGEYFYVASTFTAEGQLTRFEVDEAGLPIEESGVEILQLGPGSTPDGIAVDEDGYVYVGANLLGEIWRVDGSVDTLVEGELVADELGTPASLAFGNGPGFDPCSIYMTQLFADRVLRVSVGAEGAPLYR